MKRVCFFGMYDVAYARTRVLRLGFERNGWSVGECRVDPRWYRGIAKYIVLARLGWRARREHYDLVIVNFPGQSVVWLARLLFGKHVVFDAFLSLYDSNVFDRKLYGPWSVHGWRDWLLDFVSVQLAWRVLLDTNAHIDYFVKNFHVSVEKCKRIWISADDTIFAPNGIPEEKEFIVHFHGTFIPLQGVEYIIRAAALLKDETLQFRFIGVGQDFAMAKELVDELGIGSRVEFIGKLPIEKVGDSMARAHVVLGIFGDTPKTKRVIPNKVYEAMAMGKAIITADTPAMRELPGAADAFILVPPANPTALAAAISSLKNDETCRVHLARASNALFKRECAPKAVVGDILRGTSTLG